MQKKVTTLTPDEIKRYTVLFWKIVLGGIAFVALFILSIGLGLFGKLPSAERLENPKSNFASTIIASDGVELGGYYVQNRTPVRYDQISPNVINALVATEDNNFYNHSGIDFKRTFTIIFYNLIGRKQGASTITQQLALNLFSDEGRSSSIFIRPLQKLKEWIVAVRLERQYTKDEILAMYLNTVDWGAGNTFGIKSAARLYFNTSPDKLDPDQAALLVGMLNGPSFYNPTRNPERALNRRNFVLRRMAEEEFLSDEEAEKFKQKPLGLDLNRSDHNEGPAPYFRAVLKNDIQKILRDNSILKADGTPYQIDRDGLKIYTTIDSRMQRYAEEAQRDYMKKLQVEFNRQWGGRDPFKGLQDIVNKAIRSSDRYRVAKEAGKSEEEIMDEFNRKTTMSMFTWHGDVDTLMRPIDSVKYYKLLLRNAVMSMDPDSGYIRAWVGGINFEHFKYDQVKQGTRQVGSTAKPFTYAVAIGTKAYSPCYKVLNEPVTFEDYPDDNGNPWTPSGGENPLPGEITLRKALAYSQNYTTAYMMKQVGPPAVKALIEKMGITSHVPPFPSISLGSFDASLYDMVGAYSAFANLGIWTEPIYLLRIEDKNGAVLWENKPKVKKVLDAETAYVITDMLRDVVREGTGASLYGRYGFRTPMAGKTGTTQANSDGWFIGITPKLVTGVWTGCEDRSLRFIRTDQGGGAHSALPVFAGYMKRVLADKTLRYSKGDFMPPKGGLTINLNCDSYTQQQAGQTDLDQKLGF